MDMQGTEDLIVWHHTQASNLPCPVCEDRATKELVLQFRNPFPYSEWLDLYRCPSCQSCFYHPYEPPDYRNEPSLTQEVKWYLEIGAGIDFMIGPIARLAPMGDYRSLLDVGCGFGFVVDFARRVLGWEAVGVEPSPYGREGARMLGITVYPNYLEDVTDLDGRTFDVVFASEVIEHVPDQVRFLSLLKTYLSPSGLLVLTTPNALWVHPRAPYDILLETIQAYHAIVLSPHGLRLLLERVGLPEVYIEERHHRLIVYASSQKFDPPPLSQAERIVREAYIRYLETLAEQVSSLDAPHLASGVSCRLFKERVNEGQYKDALSIFNELEGVLQREYGDSVLVPEVGVSIARQVKSLNEFSRLRPFSLPVIYYYLGTVNLNHLRDYEYARRLFSAAFEIVLRLLNIRIYSSEPVDLLWRMKLHEGLSYLYAGRREEALSVFRFILDHRERSSEFQYVEPPADVVASAVYQSGIAELQQGRYGRALDHFLAAIDEAREAGLKELLQEAARHAALTLAQAFGHTMEKLSSEGQELRRLCRDELVQAVAKGELEGQDAPVPARRRRPWLLWRP